MQHSPSEIKEKLLRALDKEYNVINYGAVEEVIGLLENTPITKEVLEVVQCICITKLLAHSRNNFVLAAVWPPVATAELHA